jgi:hypothetical protein
MFLTSKSCQHLKISTEIVACGLLTGTFQPKSEFPVMSFTDAGYVVGLGAMPFTSAGYVCGPINTSTCSDVYVS